MARRLQAERRAAGCLDLISLQNFNVTISVLIPFCSQRRQSKPDFIYHIIQTTFAQTRKRKSRARTGATFVLTAAFLGGLFIHRDEIPQQLRVSSKSSLEGYVTRCCAPSVMEEEGLGVQWTWLRWMPWPCLKMGMKGKVCFLVILDESHTPVRIQQGRVSTFRGSHSSRDYAITSCCQKIILLS